MPTLSLECVRPRAMHCASDILSDTSNQTNLVFIGCKHTEFLKRERIDVKTRRVYNPH